MTREQAINTIINSAPRLLTRLRDDRPQWLCDVLEREAAEDSVDSLVALGLLKLDE